MKMKKDFYSKKIFACPTRPHPPALIVKRGYMMKQQSEFSGSSGFSYLIHVFDKFCRHASFHFVSQLNSIFFAYHNCHHSSLKTEFKSNNMFSKKKFMMRFENEVSRKLQKTSFQNYNRCMSMKYFENEFVCFGKFVLSNTSRHKMQMLWCLK